MLLDTRQRLCTYLALEISGSSVATTFLAWICFVDIIEVYIQRKTKGQQLKGKIVSALFHTSPHFFTLLQSFFRKFPPGLFLQIEGVLF